MTTIHVNTFENLEEAERAVQEFPFCGTCKAAVKIGQVNGYTVVTCTKRPTFTTIGGVPVFRHNGIRKGGFGV